MLRIAMPHRDGRVNEHFGSSREFIVVETENRVIKGKKVLTNEMLHDHGGLARMLAAEEVDVVITGGIGRPMAEALQLAGFKVVTGASGEVEKVVQDYLSGQLVSRPVQCSCGGHHGHTHAHGYGHHHHH